MSGSLTIHDIRRALLLCVWAWLAISPLRALDPHRTIGQYIVTRWGTRELFPGGAVNAIAQTPDGYLWIGAENGLVRFDGFNFRLLQHENTPSLPAGHVLGLLVDSDGLLWVRMESPYLLRYRNERFEQMFPVPLPAPFDPARERSATVASRGEGPSVLIGLSTGPLRYQGGKFTAVVSSGAASGLPISLAETDDGAVWVGMRDTGLFCIRHGNGTQVSGLPDQKVNVLLAGDHGSVWIGTDSGLVSWQGSITRQGVPRDLTRTPILALEQDRDRNVWISTPAGVTRMDTRGSSSEEMRDGLPGIVHAIFEDREGNIWVGGTEGLGQIRDAPFLSYPRVATEGGSLFVDSQGRTWVGGASGGLVWLRGGERHPVHGAGLDQDVVYSLSGAPGELWVGRKAGGVTEITEEDGEFHYRTYALRDGIPAGGVYAVHRSRDGSVWAGTLRGTISRIQNGRITTFAVAQGLSGDPITTISETPDGTIWAGTTGGLESFRNGAWRIFRGGDGLPPGRVNSLAVDRNGVLWIATSSGLFYWSNTRIEAARNSPDYLQGEVFGVAADTLGNLWVATDRSVVSISQASLLGQSNAPPAIRDFTTADGLPSTRGIRRDHSVVSDPLGRIWLSLQGGICVVNPSLPATVVPAVVNVQSVAVDGKALELGAQVHYPSSSRRVVFNFTGVSLAVPGRVRYRYRLDGYDHDWSAPTESREAAYTGLSPARYTFRVVASNSSGMWNGAPATLSFQVDPQIWETWWFRAAALLGIAGGIFGAFRYRIARAHAAMNVRFEERLAERTRIARELHDTLLQTFQGLMLRLQVVDDLLPPGKAKEQLEESLERADQAIAEGRQAVYDLRGSTTQGNDLAESVRALGKELGADNPTPAFRLVVEGPERSLHPMIRDEVYRVIREAIRNAFRHGKANHVEAEISYGDRVLRMRIRDDGLGIPLEVMQQGRPGHYGLAGMRERTQRIGGNLEVWSAPKAGTEVEFTIPGSIAYAAATSHGIFRLFRKKAATQ